MIVGKAFFQVCGHTSISRSRVLTQLTGKQLSARDVAQGDMGEVNDSDEVAEEGIDATDTSTHNISECDMIDLHEAEPALASIIGDDKRRSTFTFTVEEAHDQNPEQDAAESIDPDVDQSSSTPKCELEVENLCELSTRQSASPETVDSTPVIIDEAFVSEEADIPNPTTSEDAEPADTFIPDPVLEETTISSYPAPKPEEIEASRREDEVDTASSENENTELDQTQLLVDISPEGPIEATEQPIESEEPVPVPNGEQSIQCDGPSDAPADPLAKPDEIEDAEMSEFSIDLSIASPGKQQDQDEIEAEPTIDLPQGFNDASPQLDIQANNIEPANPTLENTIDDLQDQQDVVEEDGSNDVDERVETAVEDMEEETTKPTQEQPLSQAALDEAASALMEDIADGLTLTPSLSVRTESVGRKLRSPSPPPRPESGLDDATATMHLDDDTALLKDFLTRAAASKANKVATIARRTSLQNRRDSDAVRQALASPRKVLEDKDPNSPSKYDNDATLDLSQTLTLNMDQQPPLSPSLEQVDNEGAEDGKAAKSSRRSTRTRKSRLPAPSSGTQQSQTPKNISVRRADGGEPIVLKKTEAQELGLLTRSNTRKNKQGALAVNLRLMKLKTEAASSSGQDDTASSIVEPQPGKKNVRWDETLAYYQEGTETLAYALAEAQSLAMPDELSVAITTPSKKKAKESKDKKNETPKVRRVRGLGAANGTPAKGLLATASMIPDGSKEEKDIVAEKPQRAPKASKLKKMAIAPTSIDTVPLSPAPGTQLPALEVAPVGIEPNTDTKATKDRKSRLATPRKVKLPQPASGGPNLPAEGKENLQQTLGIRGASPRKGLKLPEVVVPPVVESGLPRRRGVGGGRKA